MKSLSFFKRHLYEDLLVDMMAIESWDSSIRQLMYDDEIYDFASNKWLQEVDPPRKARPSDQEAHKVFLNCFVSQRSRLGYLSVLSISHPISLSSGWN